MTVLATHEILEAIATLKRQGYDVQQTPGPWRDRPSYAFTVQQSGKQGHLVGPARESVFAAWASAAEHASQEQFPAAQLTLTPFYAAEWPERLIDPEVLAKRFGVDMAVAKSGASILREQSVYLNETHQVAVSMLTCPFGGEYGDVAWMNIRRRDRDVIRDWRELQAIKNAIIGPEHEGFELFPAESRLVDTANVMHMFVFMKPGLRLPVGFTERAVGGAAAAAAVGAVQRDIPEAL